MSEVRLTPAAQKDVSSIWDYTEDRWGVAQATKYIRGIQDGLQRLGVDPHRGRVRDEVRGGYRSYAVGSHVVFYRVSAHSVDVIRVLHQRMDPGRHL